MTTTPTSSIQSEGDLEVVVLFESHELLATIIGPSLYALPPGGTAQPHDSCAFDLFLIRVVEVFTEGGSSASIDNKFQNWSLLGGLEWIAARYLGPRLMQKPAVSPQQFALSAHGLRMRFPSASGAPKSRSRSSCHFPGNN